MRAFIEEGVIIELDRIPMVEIGRATAHPARKVTNSATDQNLGRSPPRKRRAPDAKIDPVGVRIDRFQTLIVGYRFVVATNSERVREPRREDMGFLQGSELSRGQCVELNIIQSVGRRVGCLVVHVRAEQTILVRKSVVNAGRKEVLIDDLLSGKRECSEISAGVLRQRYRVEGEISRSVRIYGKRSYADKNPLARVRRRHGRNRRDAQRLPDSFVVGKEECSILQDRSAHCSAKLVALERWNTSYIEEVPGVEFVVPDELVSAPVNLICSR